MPQPTQTQPAQIATTTVVLGTRHTISSAIILIPNFGPKELRNRPQLSAGR